jgi:hypothetical protein
VNVAKSCAALRSIPPHPTLMYLRCGSVPALAWAAFLGGVFAAAAALVVGVLATLASLTGDVFLGPIAGQEGGRGPGYESFGKGEGGEVCGLDLTATLCWCKKESEGIVVTNWTKVGRADEKVEI